MYFGPVQKLEYQLKKTWKNHQEKPDERTMQTLEAQEKKMRTYLIQQRYMIPAPPHTPQNKQQATRMTKWRRKKAKEERLDSAWAKKSDCGDETKG